MTDTKLRTREALIRASGTEERTVSTVAVPWGQRITLWPGYDEQVERGAVQDSDGALLFWRHNEPIGIVTDAADTEAGWLIDAKISSTPRGDEAYTLLRDGVITKASIGFYPIEHRETKEDDGTILITHTKIEVREVSLVPFPAYSDATVTGVREANPLQPKEKATMTDTKAIEDLIAGVREDQDKTNRRMDELAADHPVGPTASRYRSAGHILQAIASGDDEARGEYEAALRDMSGGVIADSIARPGWVGDLTRIVDEAPGIRELFATGTLPASGMSLEYGVLKADTTKVAEQVKEGDDLQFGNITLEQKNEPIKTYGGYTTLSIQAIQRSSVAYLDHTLRAMGRAARLRRNATFRAKYEAVVAAQKTAGVSIAVTDPTDWKEWTAAIIDAAVRYETLGFSLDGLIADKALFTTLATFEDVNGRPIMVVTGTGDNVVGQINPKALAGSLMGLQVRLNSLQAAPGGAFYNSEAIRRYESPMATLQDSNIINLTQSYSVYMFGANAAEQPEGITPVDLP